jgi:hypothetical protein
VVIHGQNIPGEKIKGGAWSRLEGKRKEKKKKKGIQFDLKAFSNVILYKDVSNNNNNGILCFRLVLKNNFKDI